MTPATTLASPALQALIDKGLFERLPVTFSTFFYDRIRDWRSLFPAEQSYFERLFGMFDRSEPELVDRLFAPLRDVEKRMGVSRETWPTREFNLGHVDFLNRSPHYPQWRACIADIFARVDPLLDQEIAAQARRRLVLVVSPADLPVGPDRLWLRIATRGTRIALTGDAAPARLVTEVLGRFSKWGGAQPYDAWLVEAGDEFGAPGSAGHVRVSYESLRDYRTYLMSEVRKIVEAQNVPGPRQLGEKLRALKGTNVHPDPLLAEFLRSVLLNGNGTLLINNTFVEWAATQAIRRARPTVIAAIFGVRNKVKPFSSLLIYADQEKASPVPTQADTLGSYVDLEVFYLYILQEFEKYAEYRGNTLYLFMGDAMDGLLAIGPAECPLMSTKSPVSFDTIVREAHEWLKV